MVQSDENILYYKPGDLVMLRHKELNPPLMVIVEKVNKQFKQGGETSNLFIGMKCRWFDKNNTLQEAIFSTKDLELYKQA